MDNLRQSLERIPVSSRKYILKVLCEMEEGEDTEFCEVKPGTPSQ